MYLNMDILAEELEKVFIVLAASYMQPDKLQELELNGAAILSSDSSESNLVYIAEARRLPVRWKKTMHMSLIIAGPVDQDYFAHVNVNYICVDDARFANVMNTVLLVFEKYNIFDDKLKQLIIQGASPDALCSYIAEFVNNPLVVFDSALRLQFISANASSLLNWERDAVSGLYVLPTEFINQLSFAYTDAVEDALDNAVLLRDDRLSFNMICTMNGKNTYIITIFEINTRLTKGMLEIVNYANTYLLIIFETSLQKKIISDGLIPFITSMLEGTKFSTEEMENHLNSVGWKPSDTCCCIVLNTLKGKHNVNFINTFCLKLENLFTSCVAFPYHEWSVAIVNLDKSNCDVYDIPHIIAVLLRDGLLNAGISFKYWNFDTMPIYYQQACNAYEFGRMYNPENWCYIFEEYALYYFMHYGSSRIPPRHLCHPALVQLYRYDQDNDTQLLPTLELYIKNNCNAVLTANALFIHRNTFYQRLNRILEIVKLDLGNENVRLYLHLSSRLIDMYYYELNNDNTLQ